MQPTDELARAKAEALIVCPNPECGHTAHYGPCLYVEYGGSPVTPVKDCRCPGLPNIKYLERIKALEAEVAMLREACQAALESSYNSEGGGWSALNRQLEKALAASPDEWLAGVKREAWRAGAEAAWGTLHGRIVVGHAHIDVAFSMPKPEPPAPERKP